MAEQLQEDNQGMTTIGRPSLEVNMAEVDKPIRMRFTKTKIAEMMGKAISSVPSMLI